jgi:hypothetical protein
MFRAAALLIACIGLCSAANSTASWLEKRALLINDIFGLGKGVLPTRAEPDAIKKYAGYEGLRGLVWNMTSMFEITSTVFFSPVEPGKRSKSAFFFHHGHSNCVCDDGTTPLEKAKCRPGCKSSMPTGSEEHDPGYTWWDLYNVSQFVHDLGHDLFVFSMPLKGVNLGPGTNATHLESSRKLPKCGRTRFLSIARRLLLTSLPL